MNKKVYDLGLTSISFRKLSQKEIVLGASDAGLSCIEWGSDVHVPCRDNDKISSAIRLQQEYGIRCSSYGTYFRLGETPIDELKYYIDAAQALGTNILRLWCGTKSSQNYTESEKELLFEQCRQAEMIAKENGVVLCMESHKNTLTENIADTLKLMESIDSEYFRMYWQPFQWLQAEENTLIAKAIAPYTKHIHVFNWKGSNKYSLHDAIDEWKNYIAAFDTPRTLLFEFMPDDQITSLKKETEALKIITGEIL